MARPRRDFMEIGKKGYKWHAPGEVVEEFLTQLRGSTGINTYRQMRDNDTIIGACLFAISQILREARWDVKSPKEGYEKEADFLRECMHGMDTSWPEFISDVLSMLTYGWAWFEQVYLRREDGKIVWKRFAPRKQSSWDSWEIANNGDILGMWQRPYPDFELIYLPLEKSIHFTTESANGNPEGRSILRNSYRAWYFKKNIEELEGIGIERDLTGLPKLTLPEGLDPESDDDNVQDSIIAARELITSVRRDEQEGVLLPFGWEFELVASPGQKQFDTTQVINRYNKEIAVTVLAQFVMLGMERTGSYALAKEQTDMFQLCLEGWMDLIASTVNRQAVPKLFALNGRTGPDLPGIVHSPVRHWNLKDLSTYISQLASVQALDIDDEVRRYTKQYARLSEFSEMKR